MKVVPITFAEAKAFIATWHRHNKPPNRAVCSLALEHDGEIVGVATCERPKARMLDNGSALEVSRTCTRPECPKGGVSKLLNACRKVASGLGYSKLVTYTLESESGASCRGAGWQQAELLKPAGSWERVGRARDRNGIENLRKIRWEIDLVGHSALPAEAQETDGQKAKE